jgi:hypothetical protein
MQAIVLYMYVSHIVITRKLQTARDKLSRSLPTALCAGIQGSHHSKSSRPSASTILLRQSNANRNMRNVTIVVNVCISSLLRQRLSQVAFQLTCSAQALFNQVSRQEPVLTAEVVVILQPANLALGPLGLHGCRHVLC